MPTGGDVGQGRAQTQWAGVHSPGGWVSIHLKEVLIQKLKFPGASGSGLRGFLAAGRPRSPFTSAPVNVRFNVRMGRALQPLGLPKHADESLGFSPWRSQ